MWASSVNGRRYMIWWRHPRDVCASAIEDFAWRQLQTELGDFPDPDRLFDDTATVNMPIGEPGQRKMPASVQTPPLSEEQKSYFGALMDREKRLQQEGIQLQVYPSWTWKRYPCSMGVDLVAPVEVRNEHELAQMADLARQLVRGKTSLVERFPDAVYGQADWLREMGRHSHDPCRR